MLILLVLYTHRNLTRSLLGLAALFGDEGLALDGAELSIRHDLLWSQFDRGGVFGLVGNGLLKFL